MNEDVLVYSSVAGDLPEIVREESPMCFVEWKDYVKLKEINEKLCERLSWGFDCQGCVKV